MEGLVSPAPESFHVLHSAISKINGERDCFDGKNDARALSDVRALSSFLTKPDYAIELYSDTEISKWRLIPRANSKFIVKYPYDCIQEGKTELYDENNPLQLSRMALELATKTPNDPHIICKIDDIAR
eukprot:CAMPEP_0201977220 /NCGR_PEP_ID=MMETSP0904-20121228/59938_1 /ASSEMBLY_ACC=CAM_ASM_000553 /TAXON_ID=420261 /ORGANISM="Thalassiosira antarctica, Strain CCMP982" /LENGTH=127 /DNA_ID=CAMNT_0048528541 /DNA_START=527 /DNA_END=906 /DNA_ORIENTATION=+